MYRRILQSNNNPVCPILSIAESERRNEVRLFRNVKKLEVIIFQKSISDSSKAFWCQNAQKNSIKNWLKIAPSIEIPTKFTYVLIWTLLTCFRLRTNLNPVGCETQYSIDRAVMFKCRNPSLLCEVRVNFFFQIVLFWTAQWIILTEHFPYRAFFTTSESTQPFAELLFIINSNICLWWSGTLPSSNSNGSRYRRKMSGLLMALAKRISCHFAKISG